MIDNKNNFINNDGENVKVVILDSGVRTSHPKLSQYEIVGYNAIDSSIDIMDNLGHGTAVTGIIKQHVPKAEIFVVKIFEFDYFVEFEGLCQALEYIDNNVTFDVLNISVGITECPDHERLEKVCESLAQKGVVIAAFDNFGAVSYPAAYPCVIGVDGEQKYTNPLDYDFIDDKIINIRAKGGNQRLLWNKPDYMIQSGSSFACAHITGIVAKVLQKEKLNTKNVLHLLRENAVNIFESKPYMKNKCKFEVKKAVCFPYNKEIDTLCRNEPMLNFKLDGIYDSKYSFNIGKTVCSDKEIKKIEDLDWSGDFDTVILGHIGDLNTTTKCDYYEYIQNNCLRHNKNLFQFDPTKNDEKIYSPNILHEYIPPLNYGKLFMIGKPVVAIMGTSSQQGKFSLQLSLRKEFVLRGYSVGQLGTEPQSQLFGFDEIFPCGYGADIKIDEQTAIGYLNYLLHQIEKKNPDIIFVGGQSNSLPYAMYNLRNNSPYQKELLLASNPDAIILCINYFDDVEYISRTIKYIEALTERKVIALSMSPFDKAYSWSSVSSNVKIVEDGLLEEQMYFVECETGIKVFSQSQTNELSETLITYLSKEGLNE